MQISLTDCLACSGCVTSAEAVLVSLQSHAEVLNVLDSHPPLDFRIPTSRANGFLKGHTQESKDGTVFVASVSPQVRASLAATYNISERQAGYMVDQFLAGPQGLRSSGKYNNGFTWVVDTNRLREACLVLGADEVASSGTHNSMKRPILTSACPGWICYAEKKHPHILPHLSRVKSPQALTGTLLKSVLSKALNIPPSQIWHVAIMPCFDKKLEASREELTDVSWNPSDISPQPIRDVDCVITTREVLTLASARNISLHNLPLRPLPLNTRPPFPDETLSSFLNPRGRQRSRQSPLSGPSGGYLNHILQTTQSQHPGSTIQTTRGRNADIIDYTLHSPTGASIFKAARYYGFHNIQNLVRKLNPPRQNLLLQRGGARRPGQVRSRDTPSGTGMAGYAYVEVMACPGGCTNGGGQIKVEDVVAMNEPKLQENVTDEGILVDESVSAPLQGVRAGPQAQKEWLARVDEAYFSEPLSEEEEDEAEDGAVEGEGDSDLVNGLSPSHIHQILDHWSSLVGVPLDKLAYTSYRKVESDVGKDRPPDGKVAGISTDRVVELAGRAGGGW